MRIFAAELWRIICGDTICVCVLTPMAAIILHWRSRRQGGRETQTFPSQLGRLYQCTQPGR